jgi:hypothetical protein
VGLQQALTVLADEWDDIHARLPQQASERLTALTDDFTHEGDRNASEDIATKICLLLRMRLPADHHFVAELSAEDDDATAGHSAGSTQARP